MEGMAVIDHYSVSAIPIEMRFRNTSLSLGTAFVFESDEKFFLVSTWHNFSGRHFQTGKHLSATAGEPDRIGVWWNAKANLGDKLAVDTPLLDSHSQPLWLVHPEHGHQVDIAVLPVQPQVTAEPYPINKLPSTNLLATIGMDVFILGYPYGIGPSGLPIWKRGSLASEPQMITNHQRFILIDTASRPGMSGSPVIVRSWGAVAMEGGGTAIVTGGASRFLGIYSGRLATSDSLDAQLGMVWPARFISEIIAGGCRDLTP